MCPIPHKGPSAARSHHNSDTLKNLNAKYLVAANESLVLTLTLKMNNSTPLPIHIIGCILFMLLPVLFSPYPMFSEESFTSPLAMRDFLTYALLIVFYYLNDHILLPRYYFEREYAAYIFALAICFLVILVAPSLLFYGKIQHLPSTTIPGATLRFSERSIFFDIYRDLFLFACIIFGSLAIRINAQLKVSIQDKLNAELAYLKAQINPHFLFNSLNSIYSLAIVKSDKTATAIVKLSSMMRYVLSETSERFVPLDRELIYINSYIELQKIRLDDTAAVNYAFSGETENKIIAPLVLLPFIENAFKHGVNPEETSQIDIQISVSDEYLYMHVFNLKVPHINNPEQRTGYGLENSRKQLQLLYPDRHKLSIDDWEKSFTVNLKIHLV